MQPSIATASRRLPTDLTAAQPSRRRGNGLLLVLLAATTGSAQADTIRFGLRVIADGDTSGKLLQVAGPPQSVSHAQAPRSHGKRSKKSAPAARASASGSNAAGDDAERWVYHRDGKTIVFVVSAGRVVSISERKN